MKYLLNSNNNILNKLKTKNTLLAFDLDGTLSPLVDDPSNAYIPDTTKCLLAKINKFKKYKVAIITGRSIASTKKILGELPLTIIGNHGLESFYAKIEEKEKWKKRCLILSSNLKDIFDQNEFFIENKKYSVSVHFIKKNRSNSTIKKLANTIKPLLVKNEAIILGKNVVNILPSNKSNKGFALKQIMKKYNLHQALFVGDDNTDESIFEIKKKDIIKIKIGMSRNSSATFYLKNQKEINSLLKLLNDVQTQGINFLCMNMD
ncbi:MAG: trehalose-phosphatase [Oligoflexia bacterium]|nr:trehalose-phosphatase [Oligoflexia bacterium]